jgi:MFS family permease
MASWRPAPALALLLAYFVLIGVIIGGEGVLWAEIVATLRLSDATFGMTQLASPLLSVIVLLQAGALTTGLGKKRMAAVGLVALGAALLLTAAAGGLWAFAGALAVAGLGFGLVETAMNSATLDWEHATRRSVMNAMHAGFSGGAVVGAFGAGMLLDAGWRYPGVLALLAACCAAALLATLPVRYPPPEPPADGAGSPLAALRLLAGSRAIILLAALALMGIVGESIAITWSVIYLRSLGAPALIGGAAFALFNGAMFIGRLANAPLVARYGARLSLFVSGGLLVASGVLLLVPPGVPLAVAALALAGLGVAGVIPTALSAAARLAPGNAGAVTGALMSAAYLGFIICPPLIGWIAELISLRAALVLIGASGVAIIALVGGLHRAER